MVWGWKPFRSHPGFGPPVTPLLIHSCWCWSGFFQKDSHNISGGPNRMSFTMTPVDQEWLPLQGLSDNQRSLEPGGTHTHISDGIPGPLSSGKMPMTPRIRVSESRSGKDSPPPRGDRQEEPVQPGSSPQRTASKAPMRTKEVLVLISGEIDRLGI